MRKLLRTVVPPLLFLAMFLLSWDLLVRLGGIGPYLLPSPAAVAKVFVTRSADLFAAAQITLFSAVVGFLASLIVGLITAVFFAEFRWLRISCYPYAIFLHTVPIVAISPLIITWFGYGATSVIVITFIISLFPIITSATNGFLEAPEELRELFDLYDASRLQRLLKLRFPSAIPQIVSGAQTASGMAIVGAIVGEFFAGHEAGRYGLGYYMFTAQGQFRIDILIAAILISTLQGIGLFAAVTLFAKTALRRWMTS
ncbi:ABC transporter permease [Rubinisphaera margarita]|uniref:ABC transporter permease n=1 Tax=Rubinisphaera margarita TaxID=2909586 RepID=UPI001EE98E5D|nr:ABC transporter permease [Rubinisphaera margarita]MCG6157449.1 ABC transporter permease [Rubinisphaera margarita]